MWATPSSPLLASWGEEPSPGGGRRRPGSIPSPRSPARRRERRGRPATARTPLWRLMSAGSWTREPPGRDWRVWQRVWGSLRNAAAWAAVRAPPLSLYQPSTIPVTACWRSKVSWPAQQQPILLFPHSRVFPAAVHQVPFSVPQGEKENGHRPQPGNEHSIQVLVVLPQRKFQQKNVLRVPKACLGGRVLRLQVGIKIFIGFLLKYFWLQIWSRVFVQILQLRPWEEIPSGPVQRLPGWNTPRLRVWTIVWTGEVLGIHEILQVLSILLVQSSGNINYHFLETLTSWTWTPSWEVS